MKRFVILFIFLSSFSFGQDNENTVWFFSPSDFKSPLEFIDTVKTFYEAGREDISMTNYFPSNWVEKEDVVDLILLISSKKECSNFIDPLSSYIPNGYSEVGGYAAQEDMRHNLFLRIRIIKKLILVYIM